MDPGQQFCLRWNNYQSTLQHVFHRLWLSGTFVDVTLVVEGRRLDCHKVVLSACSTYFERILQDHTHPHPLILLHDMTYSNVEALVTFMYRGEVNVAQEQLAGLLRVADTLKVKGLADSNTISSFTKSKLLEKCMPFLQQQNSNTARPKGYTIMQRNVFSNSVTPLILPPKQIPTVKAIPHSRQTVPQVKSISASSTKRAEIVTSRSPGPHKKRPRLEELPPTPPMSHTDTSPSELPQPSPDDAEVQIDDVKKESSDETDSELQIDESAGIHSEESSEAGDAPASMNSVEAEKVESEDVLDSVSSATSSSNAVLQSSTVSDAGISSIGTSTTTTTTTTTTSSTSTPTPGLVTKSQERTYTHLDLEEGIEAVLLGRLTPAKAIAQYKIPRRTFFRRLSAVRKSRGIPSAKENAAEHYLSNGADSQTILGLPTSDLIEENGSVLKVKLEKTGKGEGDSKSKKKCDSVMAPNNSYFSLLNLAASNNYDAYLNYLKLVAQQEGVIPMLNPEESSDGTKKLPVKDSKGTVDDNRNVAAEIPEAALALVTQNGSPK